MNERERLAAQKKRNMRAMNAILDAAEKANRELNAAEKAEMDALEAETIQINAELAALDAPGANRKTAPAGNSFTSHAWNSSKPAHGTADWRAAARGFNSHADFLSAIINAGSPGQAIDPRLAPLAAVGSDEHGTNSPTFGGFLVPQAFSPNMLSIVAEDDPIANLTMKLDLPGGNLSIPSRIDKDHSTSVSGGLRVYRRAQTGSATPSRMQTSQVALKGKSLMGYSFATEELLSRSPQGFATLLEAGFRSEFSGTMVTERLYGDGATEMLGIVDAPCTVVVSKESGQPADTIVYENVVKMRARCWGYKSAIWLANNDTLPMLMLMNQAVGTGGLPVWQPSGREDHPDLLLGRPIVFTEYAKTLGDKGDLVLGNWSQYIDGTETALSGPATSGIQMAESMHVRFEYHERAFKFWLNNDGAPWWNAPLTPKNSAATMSPFVVLEAR